VDEIVAEPHGGAHTDHPEAARLLGDCLERQLDELVRLPSSERKQRRHLKFRSMGSFLELVE
jgi:acetyl-CoA carboxylase carboxyl transferase subunit alpha